MASRIDAAQLSSAMRVLAALVTIVSIAAFLGACALAMASAFAFAAPRSEQQVLLWLLVIGAWVAPIAYAAATFSGAFAAFSGKRRALRVALVCFLAPTVYLAVVGTIAWFAFP